MSSSKAKSKSKSQPEETVLLRQAKPRYDFVGRKLPKGEHHNGSKHSQQANVGSTNTPETGVKSGPLNPSFSKKPVAIVEGSCQSANNGHTSGQAQVTTASNAPLINDQGTVLFGESKIVASQGTTHREGTPAINTSQTVLAASSPSAAKLSNIPSQALIEENAAALALSSITNSLSIADRLNEVEKERDQLKMDLNVQLQVNSELKRLLVASVGEDLGERVQRLVRDRAQLSFDIGGFSKKMREDYEHLDKVSIQADMWRSKYLASRVMVEELGNARAFYSLQCHDAHDALQQMLNERHELRTNLLDSYKVLQQVKGAFDPLNSHRSSSLPSTNVLDLSRSCQQLAEAVRFRLLPSHVTSAATVEIDLDSWDNSVTRAEQYAHELLSRPSEPPGSLHSGCSHLLPIAGGNTPSTLSPLINRFHPHVRHDNLTFTCCKCKGEISVI